MAVPGAAAARIAPNEKAGKPCRAPLYLFPTARDPRKAGHRTISEHDS